MVLLTGKETTMAEKTRYLGRESGKSSSRWFGGGQGIHPRGNGASTGDGRTTDTEVAGQVEVTFREAPDNAGSPGRHRA